ncbi:MAG TPA: site-specific DNA-methyltransferase [Pyrinomonadaceae bacterium]|jgi:site-specific DNA-methyltransferase (adenine-specific)|nr:site-specific DNA-methyltransferase [Pyrinomonadaceae bacterium]
MTPMQAMARTQNALRTSIHEGDARELGWIADSSVHLVVTSPPYWTLKRYHENDRQMGHIEDYETFHDELDKVWSHCFRVLVPGGRVVCVVGDVCLSRRKNGRHVVMPMHADIIVRARKIGFDNLTPIIWHKISNANYEVENGSSFLGKPYEPNAIIKNDAEFILMLRKPGGYRQPTAEQRDSSRLTKEEHAAWFQQIWTLPGESTREHPAPFPEKLAHRLVRMFSFTGDTVLDPFMGTGTTLVASLKAGRNSIGVELQREYLDIARRRLNEHLTGLFVDEGNILEVTGRSEPHTSRQVA